MSADATADDELVARLRAAGCVFAEDEAAILRERAGDAAELDALTRRRVAGEPLEALVGWVDFGGHRLSVGPGVFVPRRRSLLLADQAIAAVRSLRSPRPVLVEAFAGVAPIASAVVRAAPTTLVHVIDIDPTALIHARTNLGPDAGLHTGSVLDPLPRSLRGRVDVIAAVPPYVPDGARGELPREAVDHEPGAALFGGTDGLELVRALLAQAPAVLAPAGRVLIELATGQAAVAVDHARALGFELLGRRSAPDGTTVLDVGSVPRVLEHPRAGHGPGDAEDVEL